MKKSNFLFFITIFIISLLIILIHAYLGRYNIIIGDDFFGIYAKNSRLIDCLSFGFQTHGGGVFMYIFKSIANF